MLSFSWTRGIIKKVRLFPSAWGLPMSVYFLRRTTTYVFANPPTPLFLSYSV